MSIDIFNRQFSKRNLMRGLVSAFIYLIFCVVLISVPSLAPNNLSNLAFGTISLATFTMIRGGLLSGVFLFVLLSIKDCIGEINLLIKDQGKKQMFLPLIIFIEVFLLEYIIATFGAIFCEVIAFLSPLAAPGTELANSYWLAYMRNLPYQTLTFKSQLTTMFAELASMFGGIALLYVLLKAMFARKNHEREENN